MRRKLRRRATRAAVVGAIAAGSLVLANIPAASAATGLNTWPTQIGPAGAGCYAYLTYTSNIVTPHIWQQPGNSNNTCWLWVNHVGYNSGGGTDYINYWPSETGVQEAAGPSTVVDGPSWYYGPWNSNKMCVIIGAGDDNTDVGSNGNQVEVCPW
jgi:hypothetical protein